MRYINLHLHYITSRGSAPSNRIGNNTTLRSPKQQIWFRPALCGGWCRHMALCNRELHARNDEARYVILADVGPSSVPWSYLETKQDRSIDTVEHYVVKVKVKEVDLYSAFIVVRHTQGAEERIPQCYLQITPYLPLPRKHSPDGASPDWGCGHLIAAYYHSFIYPKSMKGWVGLSVCHVRGFCQNEYYQIGE